MAKTTAKQLAKAAENWQRCRQEDLPRALFAYDSEQQLSKRVVSYRLEGKKEIEALIKDISKQDEFYYMVHLGLRDMDLQGPIGERPLFTMYIQLVKKGKKKQREAQELDWYKDSRFGKLMEDGTKSGLNAIPAASAYLFVQAWLELPEIALSRPFTAEYRVLGERVKSYVFSVAESRSIYLDLKNSKEDRLDIHLGKGMAVWDHPFSFRPVVEVKRAVAPGKVRTTPMNATGLLNPEGDSFYDFGRPVPPKIPD
jgi:hypothetical protein